MRIRLAITVFVVVGMIAPAAATPLAPQTHSVAPVTSTAPEANSATSTATASESQSSSGSSADTVDAANYTKLYVDDRYANLRIKPGESDSFAVTVENGEDEAVDVTPHLVAPEIRQRPVDDNWVSISDGNVTLDAGEEQEFEVTVSVPEDAELDRYQGAVAFTDETVHYPGRPAQPVYAASFNVQVWEEPTVQVVGGDYLRSQIEAGDSYTHTIVVENTGDQSAPLNPQIGDERRTRPGANDDGLERSWFEIDAPNEVEAGETATVEVTISPPEDAALDRYRTEIDLGLKDPARPEGSDYWQRVDLNFQVWNQPDEPFETQFEVSENAADVALELSAAHHRPTSASEPASFDVTFVAPNGTEFDAERVRQTTRGSVDLTERDRPGIAEDDSAYSSDGERQAFRYRIDEPESGTWTVKIMPENTMRFNYETVRNESE